MIEKFKAFKSKIFKESGTIIHHDNSAIVKNNVSDPNFPFLISFPRTGSHWLRIIMELYFEKPSLKRVFYYKNAKDFACYHTHALNEDYKILNLKRNRFIYLYRDAPETIFSQLKYLKLDVNDSNNVQVWSDIYAKHLDNWLIKEKFSEEKVVIKYERMRNDIETEFLRLCDFLGEPFEPQKLTNVVNKISKEKIKTKTRHDQQVINMSANYANERNEFIKMYEAFIWDRLWLENNNLKKLFN